MKNSSSLTPYRRAWRNSLGRNPMALLDEMKDTFERGFEDWPRLSLRSGAWRPEMDAFEKDGELVVKVDLPGVKKSDVKVSMHDGSLELQGERKEEKKVKEDDFYRCERSYGKFYRSLPMPDGVKDKDIKANFKGGVLEVHVALPPEAKEASAKEIPIS